MRRMAIAVLGMVGVGLAGGASAQQNADPNQNANPARSSTLADNPTSAEARLAAWEQHQRMDRESPMAGRWASEAGGAHREHRRSRR